MVDFTELVKQHKPRYLTTGHKIKMKIVKILNRILKVFHSFIKDTLRL